MILTRTIVDVRQVGGGVRITDDTGAGMFFHSVADFQAELARFRGAAPWFALMAGLDKYANVDPTFSTPGMIEGHSVTLNTDAGTNPLMKLS